MCFNDKLSQIMIHRFGVYIFFILYFFNLNVDLRLRPMCNNLAAPAFYFLS